MIRIRKSVSQDRPKIWKILHEVIAGGDTYVFAPDSSEEEMLRYWCGQDKHTYVAELKNELVGTFIIKDNFPGLGSHVAMQFNIVVKTNERAIRLWQKLGFEIKGEIPGAFRHIKEGYVDANIMWREL